MAPAQLQVREYYVHVAARTEMRSCSLSASYFNHMPPGRLQMSHATAQEHLIFDDEYNRH